MKNEIIVGLDIGTTKIACFVGQKQENGKVKILGYGKTDSLGVDRGIVRNIRLASESIKKAVSLAQEMADYEITEVYAGVAGQHIKSLSTQGSVMIDPNQLYIEEEDVQRLIQQQRGINLLPGEEIVHLFPQTYFVDGEELTNCEPVGVKGNKLDCVFHMVTGNSTNLECIKHSVVGAGLKLKGLVLEPVASSYSVLDDREREAGIALVDIGGGTTDIAVFQDSIIRHTSVLPLAGNAITNDIKEGCGVMKNQAEALKTRFGCCMPQEVHEDEYVSIPVFRGGSEREIGLRYLANIIKDRTETILEQVNFEIQQSGFGKKLIAGLVLTGGGAQLKNIKEYAAFITGIDTRIGMPNEHLDASTPKELIHPMYATGIGLVLYGIEQSELMQGKEEIEVENNKENIAPPPAEENESIDFHMEEDVSEENAGTTRKRNNIRELGNNLLNFLGRFTSGDSDGDSLDDE